MEKYQPVISFIISAYNSASTLPVCLSSVLRLSYPQGKIEVHIVNDGSTDNTTAVLKKLSLPGNFQAHIHESNRGLSAARNTGIRHSTGEILFFLDADMEVPENYVQQHLNLIRKDQVIGVVSCLRPSPKNRYDKYQRYLYEAKRGAARYPPGSPLPFQAFIFCATSVKKRAIDQTGWFDDSITTYGGEDTEYSYRLWNQYPDGLFYSPGIQVIHHHYRTFRKALDTIEQFGKTVVPYLVKKHPEFEPLYGLSFLDYPTLHSIQNSKLKPLCGWILKSHITFKFFRLLYRITPYPLSNIIVRILMASSLLRGISQSLKR
jgi:glycosyltransferase involved in cell wall biosynthesis